MVVALAAHMIAWPVITEHAHVSLMVTVSSKRHLRQSTTVLLQSLAANLIPQFTICRLSNFTDLSVISTICNEIKYSAVT